MWFQEYPMCTFAVIHDVLSHTSTLPITPLRPLEGAWRPRKQRILRYTSRKVNGGFVYHQVPSQVYCSRFKSSKLFPRFPHTPNVYLRVRYIDYIFYPSIPQSRRQNSEFSSSRRVAGCIPSSLAQSKRYWQRSMPRDSARNSLIN